MERTGPLLSEGFPGRGPLAMVRGVVTLTFRGSRSDLERVTGLRLDAALVLIVLAARCVHLSQAAVDLTLAGSRYPHEAVAVALGVACLVESTILAAMCLRANSLTPAALLCDAVFGAAGLGVISFATTAMQGRAGSLNWMLPYTVTTATALGLLAGGDLVARPDQPASRAGSPLTATARRWPAAVALALGLTYLLSELLPRRPPDESLAQVGGNAANYVVFFVGAFFLKLAIRRRLALIASRNAEVTQAAAQVAHEAQWRAVAVDVFGPVVDLLDRVATADDGDLAPDLRQEADRLISMIEAVRPVGPGSETQLASTRAHGSAAP